ncbi:GAF domain-containing protein, partial [Serratia marcescens]|uniref:GAF domain-containing protein n=1 Tax=Serratia marcescens TaxID=615 RepID=UPI00111514E3
IKAKKIADDTLIFILPAVLSARFITLPFTGALSLYVRNRTRSIPDVDYTPAPLRPAGFETVDLSDVGLRSVSPVHVRYLQNMGVASSASISIVKDGVLWGMIACHHYSARRLSSELRAAAAALASGLARQIRA